MIMSYWVRWWYDNVHYDVDAVRLEVVFCIWLLYFPASKSDLRDFKTYCAFAALYERICYSCEFSFHISRVGMGWMIIKDAVRST